MRDLSSDYSHRVVIGDFNAELMSHSCNACYIQKFSESLALPVVQHGSTYFGTVSGIWIDIMMVDENDYILNIQNVGAPYSSKHNIVRL